MERAAHEQFESADWFLGPLRPPHSIVEGAVRVRLLKWARCGQWHGPRWYRGPKLEAQKVLVEREDVPILCLTRQASHGLDLSFLTHVVLLEPIRDSAPRASCGNQSAPILSRARTASARRSCFVRVRDSAFSSSVRRHRVEARPEKLQAFVAGCAPIAATIVRSLLLRLSRTRTRRKVLAEPERDGRARLAALHDERGV